MPACHHIQPKNRTVEPYDHTPRPMLVSVPMWQTPCGHIFETEREAKNYMLDAAALDQKLDQYEKYVAYQDVMKKEIEEMTDIILKNFEEADKNIDKTLKDK